MFQGYTQETVDFMWGIRFNNERNWFLAHKDIYLTQLSQPMKELGSEIYDFRGVSGDLTPENPLYGLYLFKKGFGGELVEFCGEFEMVYNKAADFLVNKGLGAARSVRHKLHELRHRDEGKQHRQAVEARGAGTQEPETAAKEET